MATARQSWDHFKLLFEDATKAVASTTSASIKNTETRRKIRDSVADYFTDARPALLAAGVGQAVISSLDADLQTLLGLASTSSPKTSCLQAMNSVRAQLVPVEVELLKRVSQGVGTNTLLLSDVERRILDTLYLLLPSAAVSYEQAMRDLAGNPRLSYRGSATELREAVREVLDHLAPDADVAAAAGFKLESDQTKPTQKQKMQYILKARQVSGSSIKTSVDALATVSDRVGSFARSVYTRASLSTHTQTTLSEVRQLKQYVDAVLGELLEIHKPSPEPATTTATRTPTTTKISGRSPASRSDSAAPAQPGSRPRPKLRLDLKTGKMVIMTEAPDLF